LENSDKLLQDSVALDPHPTYLYTNDMCVDLRIEFCKSKAHTDHWAEEVELLQEEMKQVKRFFETQACHWAPHADSVGKTNPVTDLVMAEGLCVYVNEQLAQFCVMWLHCKHLWQYVDAYVALGQGEVVPKEAEGGDEEENA